MDRLCVLSRPCRALAFVRLPRCICYMQCVSVSTLAGMYEWVVIMLVLCLCRRWCGHVRACGCDSRMNTEDNCVKDESSMTLIGPFQWVKIVR